MLPNDDEIMKEATKLLRDLIRINTTNPPGNELKAAQYLSDFLSQEGFEPEILEAAEERGNLLTHLPGGDGKSLLFLSHLDVVAANPEGWDVDPFSGELRNGFIYGRGALDCKSLTVIEILVMVLLKREGFHPTGDIILAAVADEEVGGQFGAEWLVENYPNKVRADYVINEGGGVGIPINGKTAYLVNVAEKGVFWTKLRTRGTPGHASMPSVGDNALVKMANIIEKLGKHQTTIEIQDVVRTMMVKLVGAEKTNQLLLDPAQIDQQIEQLSETRPELGLLRPLIRMTIAPTIFQSGVKVNIIPDLAEASLDCRLLPGQDIKDLTAELTKALGDLSQLEIESIQASPGTSSPHQSELFFIIEKQILAVDPSSICVPYMVSGGTDSRFFRELFGSVAYGFQPLKPDFPLAEYLKMVHGYNERISQNNLVFGTKILYNVTKTLFS